MLMTQFLVYRAFPEALNLILNNIFIISIIGDDIGPASGFRLSRYPPYDQPRFLSFKLYFC